jgi:nitroimidazol reductase NimA-like FMN-containing flavoprotein (pyridoxamine 5'-phosphate oxidase superfamily)
MSAKETIHEVLNNHNLVRIATLDSTGLPCVRSVDYARGDEENILYFMTSRQSNKVQQIKDNGDVGFAVDHDCPNPEDLQKLKYIKGQGRASIIEDPQEMMKAMDLLVKKFPFLKDMPGDPSDFLGVRVELKEVSVTDNTIQFGHTETISF